MRRYALWHGTSGSYVNYLKFANGAWVLLTSWLIPNTQIED